MRRPDRQAVDDCRDIPTRESRRESRDSYRSTRALANARGLGQHGVAACDEARSGSLRRGARSRSRRFSGMLKQDEQHEVDERRVPGESKVVG